jgi:hypothetical protein
MITQGVPFHGEFASADASALSEPNSRFTLYSVNSKTTFTIGAADKIFITDVWIWSVAAVILSVYDGADNTVDAGEKIIGTTAAVTANYNAYFPFMTAFGCQTGTYPKVKAGAGQIDVLIRGFISGG